MENKKEQSTEEIMFNNTIANLLEESIIESLPFFLEY
jgi:hypothetical protein